MNWLWILVAVVGAAILIPRYIQLRRLLRGPPPRPPCKPRRREEAWWREEHTCPVNLSSTFGFSEMEAAAKIIIARALELGSWEVVVTWKRMKKEPEGFLNLVAEGYLRCAVVGYHGEFMPTRAFVDMVDAPIRKAGLHLVIDPDSVYDERIAKLHNGSGIVVRFQARQ
jgi:hypothetical protein